MKINSDDALFRIGEVTVLMSCLVAGVLLSASVALGTDAEANKPVLETELESEAANATDAASEGTSESPDVEVTETEDSSDVVREEPNDSSEDTTPQPTTPEPDSESESGVVDSTEEGASAGNAANESEIEQDTSEAAESSAERAADRADGDKADSDPGVNDAGEEQTQTDSSYTKSLTEHGVDCSGSSACSVIATGLSLRALPRSFSPLYADADDSVDPISNAVSAFKPMFVFGIQDLDDRDPASIGGWYQLGYSERRAIGWMKAQDIIEWRQALLLEYSHPGTGSNRRTPVLMFSEMEALQDFVTTNGRKSRTQKLLDQIDSGEVPEQVIGKEPNRFLNIDDDFYLLPVVNWQREETFDDPSHYLQVVAAVPGSRAESAGESTLQDEDYLQEDLFDGEAITDIVFVMDMTGSMQPYIDAVKKTLGNLVKNLAENEQTENTVRFGLVGYRDNIEATPDLNWDIKQFTPELLPAADFLAVLNQAEAAKVSSDEWAENVHGGYLAGINSPWRTLDEERNSIRLMLLIGDASGHDVGDVKRGYKNSTGSTAEDLYELARTSGIIPYTIHLKNERAEREWGTAQQQFAQFAYKQTDGSNFTFSAQTDQAEENLIDTAQYIGSRIKTLIEGGVETMNDFAGSDSDPQAPDSSNEEGQQMIELARGVMQAAIADFLGDGVEPPRDFTSWVHDYDLADASRETLSVRVMISRRQFDNVIRQTESLVEAIQLQTLGNVDFLVALKQAAARTSLGLELKSDTSFEDQEFLPNWISSLPYKSRVMAMSPDEFANLKVNERRQFIARLESKLNAYDEIAGNVDRWLKLDENDDSLQEVVALPLTLLP